MGKLESSFQAELRTTLEFMFPGCIVLKNDPTYLQGIPDLTILYLGKWAFLECKREPKANKRANQSYYVGLAQNWAFGAFIYPENEKEVLEHLYEYFKC